MLLDLMLIIGLLLSTTSQLRVAAIPIGPGEALLLLWLAITATREMARLGPPLTHALSRLLIFWSAFAAALCLGAMTGYAMGDMHDPRWFYHDIAAYGLAALISCFGVIHLEASGRLRPRIWLFVGLGTGLLALQAVLGWFDAGGGQFATWEWDRLRGLTENANQLALTSAIIGLLALHLADTARQPLPRLAAGLCIVVAVVVGRLTKSDAFLLVIAVSGVVYVLMKLRTWMLAEVNPLPLRSAAAWALALSLPFAVALAAPFGSSLAQQAEAVAAHAMRGGGERETRETANLRIAIWSEAMRRGLEALALGLGPGPHLKIPDEIAIGRRSTSGGPQDVPQPEVRLAPNFEAHNTVLDVFVQGGLPALLGLGWLIGGILVGAWRGRLDAVTTLVCGLAAYSLLHFILRQPVVWFALVFCLAATAGPFPADARQRTGAAFPTGDREPCAY